MNKIKQRLRRIYGEQENIETIYHSILQRIEETKAKKLKQRKPQWDEKDVVLITYGDQFQQKGQAPLKTFKQMFDRYLTESFSLTHILPFYPYSSDDGFSVIDYKQVNEELGTWKDIEHLSHSTRLMFDHVCNHVSQESQWFQKYLAGDPEVDNYFISPGPDVDTSAVTRPRATPLLSRFTMHDGEEHYIWTTFSRDQVDVNYENPLVLLEMIDVLLFYMEQGAEYVRLDAIGFMWKEMGTACIHHEKTHEIIKLFRDVTDLAAEGTVLITETNVPHEHNISYFGNGNDEAHMVYQFPLPPLVLYSVYKGSAEVLSQWARSLPAAREENTFFNFLASHDGIGLNPIRGLVPEKEILDMVEGLEKEGALVSSKQNEDGSESPYELNVTYMDALSKQTDDDTLRLKRMLVAHSILLTMPGVPSVYIQSMIGSRNDEAGVAQTSMNRSINRKKFDYPTLQEELDHEGSLREQTLLELNRLIAKRKNEPLFHPASRMEVLQTNEKLFAFIRKKRNEEMLVVHNLSSEQATMGLHGSYVDILTDQRWGTPTLLTLDPYQFVWLKKVEEGV
ncbi:alpha-amylase family glycosyl hydrolase [Shouchella shacheensis]|uniref:alpha-amylase family glycosyl hydrolase n=1 Tax=Shouchella shacheensis TaxID=1649580 RepID=UPI00073FFD24|nr:alpha-amylase family glycosyl hydrolase [Shouchella shacheensis]